MGGEFTGRLEFGGFDFVPLLSPQTLAEVGHQKTETKMLAGRCGRWLGTLVVLVATNMGMYLKIFAPAVVPAITPVKESTALMNGMWARGKAYLSPTVTSTEWAASALLASEVKMWSRAQGEEIHRPDITHPITSYLNTKSGHGYMVVIGPRGGGKSTAVTQAVKGRKGTIGISVNEKTNIYEVITEALYRSERTSNATENLRKSNYVISNEMQLDDLLLKATDMHEPHDPLWRPTFVVEIDRGAQDRLVKDLARVFKRLSVDLRAAHVILVLSNEVAAFALPSDPTRQKKVWVEDYTLLEAESYLDIRGFLIPTQDKNKAAEDLANVEQRRKLFKLGGTRPSFLKMVCDMGEPLLDQTLAEFLGDAEDEIRGLLWKATAQQFASDFARLTCELLKTTDDVGVPSSATGDYLAPPDTVVEAFKKHHAMVYHSPSRAYRFFSPAHRHAAQRIHSCARRRRWRAGQGRAL